MKAFRIGLFFLFLSGLGGAVDGASGSATTRPGSAAEELSVLAQVDRSELKRGEVLNFSVAIAGPLRQLPRLELASFEGFRVVSTGQSQHVQMKGGRMMQRLTFTYVLTPVTVGTHTLGAVKVEIQGRVYETQPIEVKVLPGGEAPTGGQAGPGPERERPPKPQLKGGITL